MTLVLKYANCVWLAYHIFLVISWDWILESSQAEPTTESTADDEYVGVYVNTGQAETAT